MSEALFYGNGLNVVDSKSRLSIPACLRSTLAARGSAREVLMGPGHNNRPCLIAYDKGEAVRMRDKFQAKHGMDTSNNVYDENAELAGYMEEISIDEAGRFVLTPLLRSYGELGNHIWFIAGFGYFELWDPWTFLAQPSLKPQHRKAIEINLAAKGLPLERPA